MIAVCGEALVDLVESIPGTYRALPGGSPANVAVGISRLGVPVALLARVSVDGFGRLLTRHLLTNGVDDRYLLRVDAPTTLAVAALDEQGRAEYDFYVSGTADWQWTVEELPAGFGPEVRILHTGSLALTLPPGASVLEELMRRERDSGRVLVSYDPNLRPTLEPDPAGARRRVERQVAAAHVVKASSDDLSVIYPGRDSRDVARHWLTLGPALVVITLGPDGAVAVTHDCIVSLPSPPVTVVDTVGAGDAFMAGLLVAIAALRAPSDGSLVDAVTSLSQQTATALVDTAVAAAALTCTRPGADPPTRDELRAWTATRQ